MKYRLIFFILSNFSIVSCLLHAQNINQDKYKLAESYERNGDYKSALRLIKDLYQTNLKNADYFNALVRNEKNLNQYSELLTIVEDRQKLVQNMQQYSLLGELYWRTGKIKEANENWEAALNLYSKTEDVYKYVAEAQIQVHQLEKAIQTYKKGENKLNNEFLFSANLSKLFIATGNYIEGSQEILDYLSKSHDLPLAEGQIYALMSDSKSKEFLKNLLKKRTEDEDGNLILQMLYAWYLRTSGQFTDALDVYKRIDRISNAEGRELLQFADVSRSDGQYEIALQAYSLIIDMGKKSRFLASAMLGFARTAELRALNGEKPDKAEAQKIIGKYRQAIKEFPNDAIAADAMLSIANIQINYLNDEVAAKAELETVLKLFTNLPLIAEALNQLASIQIKADNLDEAAATLAKIINKRYKTTNPKEYEKAEFTLAKIEYYRSNLDSARAIFEKVARNYSSSVASEALDKYILLEQNKSLIKALVAYSQAEYLEARFKADSAFHLYESAARYCEGEPLSERIKIQICEFLIRIKDIEKAKLNLLDFLKNYPESIYTDKALLLLGNSYYSTNEKSEATQKYNEILNRFPRSIYLQEVRDKIRKIKANT
ncbi:MAG: tetratricopeptide repeat protein [Candidatus Kapabacteria bacterium]|nr:tetratricopeptide repeat protein [Candidatus Kapabacteria bacterium]